jgi:hypothetical protein
VISTRSVYDDVSNVLDYLQRAELTLYVNPVSMDSTRVSWHGLISGVDFMTTHVHATLEQYKHWVENGTYSAMLLDGSLLQITYDVRAARLVGHRLAYVPCPFVLDPDLIRGGLPIVEIVELYGVHDVALRSPVRFDYDLSAARPGHPAAHFTINSADCRIACVAPLHVLRFVDLIFRQFYPRLWAAHEPFFSVARARHLGDRAITVDETSGMHFSWDIRASASG